MKIDELTVEERLNIVVNHAFDGWHHVGGRKCTGTDGGVQFCVFANLGTFDFDQLTRLVVACHVVRVRAEISQGGPRTVKIYLNPRANKPDSWSQHHPNGFDLVKMVPKLITKLEDAK